VQLHVLHASAEREFDAAITSIFVPKGLDKSANRWRI
jgi:hypothetical protein